MFDDNTTTTAPEAKSNLPDTSAMREWYRKALIAKIAEEDAHTRYTSKRGEYRNLLKSAEEHGMDIESITNVLAKRFQDPDAVIRTERARLQMYAVSGFLPGIMDLFNQPAVPEPTTDEVRQAMLLDAFDKGILAGRQGRKLEDVNRYAEGSELHLKFNDGYKKGQESIAQEMAIDAPPVPRRRGRPPGAVKKKPDAPPPETVQPEVAEAALAMPAAMPG